MSQVNIKFGSSLEAAHPVYISSLLLAVRRPLAAELRVNPNTIFPNYFSVLERNLAVNDHHFDT